MDEPVLRTFAERQKSFPQSPGHDHDHHNNPPHHHHDEKDENDENGENGENDENDENGEMGWEETGCRKAKASAGHKFPPRPKICHSFHVTHLLILVINIVTHLLILVINIVILFLLLNMIRYSHFHIFTLPVSLGRHGSSMDHGMSYIF